MLARGELEQCAAQIDEPVAMGSGRASASWQARLISFGLRHTFKPLLAAAAKASQIRALMACPTGFMVPMDVRISEATVGGVSGEWVEPTWESTNHFLLYIHGGGFVACSARTHRAISSGFAQQGFRVFVPNYRLAPEHAFPAALIDVIAAYNGLRATAGEGCKIVIAGDSAGGGLVLAALLALRDANQQLPGAAALFCPFLDLSDEGGSRRTNEKSCALLTRESLARFARLYLGNADPGMPLASPIRANLERLPPLHIQVAADEMLLDDSTGLANRARKAGLQVELLIWRGVPHAFPLFHHLVPEGRRSVAAAGRFLRLAATGHWMGQTSMHSEQRVIAAARPRCYHPDWPQWRRQLYGKRSVRSPRL